MTAQDVFSITVDLISERLDNGNIDPTNTANYQKRTPGLLTMIQNELLKHADLLDTIDITANGIEGYNKVSLPSDFLALHQVVDKHLVPYNEYRKIGDDYYFPYNFTGKMIYKRMPEPITNLTDNMSFNNYICSTVIPNGLAGQLLLNENSDLANYFNSRYEELKQTLEMKEPSEANRIKDVYDASLYY